MSYPNMKLSKMFAIHFVKLLIIERSFAMEYCLEDLQLKPRGTSTNIKPPDNCKLSSCLPRVTSLEQLSLAEFSGE